GQAARCARAPLRLRSRVPRHWRADGDQRGSRSAERQRRPAPAAQGGGPMTDLEQGLRRPPPAELDGRALTAGLSRRAGEAGLLDVAYAETDSPIGELIVFVTPRGLLRVKYAD